MVSPWVGRHKRKIKLADMIESTGEEGIDMYQLIHIASLKMTVSPKTVSSYVDELIMAKIIDISVDGFLYKHITLECEI